MKGGERVGPFHRDGSKEREQHLCSKEAGGKWVNQHAIGAPLPQLGAPLLWSMTQKTGGAQAGLWKYLGAEKCVGVGREGDC